LGITQTNLARGVLFEGGTYETFTQFDPVVTRLITEDGRIPLWETEPLYLASGWSHPIWAMINSVQVPEGLAQQVNIIPAQYRATNPQLGTERLFKAMTYTVYYSHTRDFVPPTIWAVDAAPLPADNAVQLSVEATDFSGVVRVVVTYTDGNGTWYTIDLTPAANEPGQWHGMMPLKNHLEYFVQVVDGGGNVSVQHNRGNYFINTHSFMPFVSRD
jgi:hypothetical protein